MSVSAIQPQGQYQPCPSCQPRSNQSFDQLHAQERDALISITTDEGDIVTLSSNSLFSESISAQSWDTPLSRGMNFTAEILESESFSFSVKGDLNDEELADLAGVYDKLATIAEDFYSGDMAKAMDGAMSIGDMGSLANLSASFNYSETTATRLTSHHVIPASEEGLAHGFKDLPPLADRETSNKKVVDHNELLKAQWQQVKNFLDNREIQNEEANAVEAEEKASEMTAAQKMMDTLQETMSEHPRLSPFAVPLAHRAMEEGGDNLRPADRMLQRESMKIDFLAELENWLAA